MKPDGAWTAKVLGVPIDKIKKERLGQTFETFTSLLEDDRDERKIKALADVHNAPKRVEIKELEMALKMLVNFDELNTKRKMRVCRHVAFIIKDLASLYNMCREGGPMIEMEYLGYKSTDDMQKGKKRPTTFKYFNRLQKSKNPRFPISDHITNKDAPVSLPPHEDDGKLYAPKRMDELDSSAAEQAQQDGVVPYSDQEHEIERVRDRVRVRLNLIDLDFRNLHVQIEKLYQDGQAPQKTQEA